MIPPNQEQKSELEHVLSSGIFSKAPRQAKLLKHICGEYFEGRAEQIKEYTLATEVLGRNSDFDQNRDAIVRVEFHRLRKKLKEYYEREGAARPLEIVIDSGQYVPRFVTHRMDSAVAAGQNGEKVHPLPVSAEESSPIQGQKLSARMREWLRFPIWAIAIGGLILGAFLVVAFLKLGTRFGSRVSSWPMSPSPTPAAPPAALTPLESIRILCGYPKDKYIDRAGNVWLGDRFFSGGETDFQPLQFLVRAPDVALYQGFRFGDFTYDIPLRPGNYELHLYFLETHYGPGSLSGGGETSRMFDVLMNGKVLLHLFDIIKDAGGNNIADERVFKDIHPDSDNHLHLRFHRLLDSPILNALAIVPAPPGRINPIRILAQNNSYTDRAGNIWSPDRYFRGGQMALHQSHAPVGNTPDPGLYISERFGNFSYVIPVAPGKYKVTFRFAETYWGIQNTYPNLPDQHGSPLGGVGSRVFDVECNGTTLLKGFDIFKEAGGPLIARDKSFHSLQPDAQGKLFINFVPVVDYACVNAIEVEEESE